MTTQRRTITVTVTLTVAELAYALGVLGAIGVRIPSYGGAECPDDRVHFRMRGGTNSMKTNAAKAKALDKAERAYRKTERAYLAYKKAERAYKEAWRACKVDSQTDDPEES